MSSWVSTQWGIKFVLLLLSGQNMLWVPLLTILNYIKAHCTGLSLCFYSMCVCECGAANSRQNKRLSHSQQSSALWNAHLILQHCVVAAVLLIVYCSGIVTLNPVRSRGSLCLQWFEMSRLLLVVYICSVQIIWGFVLLVFSVWCFLQ